MKKLVLASASPRRKELLESLGYPFEVRVSDIEEKRYQDETPFAYVRRLSLEKASAVPDAVSDSCVVIGSDTVVTIAGEVLEKPKDKQDFLRMFSLLSGQTHQVITAVSAVNGKKHQTISVSTNVTFNALSQQEIEQYWLTGEPADKAGGYGIQGIAGKFVTHIEGSYHSVVGLPLFETDQLLKQFL